MAQDGLSDDALLSLDYLEVLAPIRLFSDEFVAACRPWIGDNTLFEKIAVKKGDKVFKRFNIAKTLQRVDVNHPPQIFSGSEIRKRIGGMNGCFRSLP